MDCTPPTAATTAASLECRTKLLSSTALSPSNCTLPTTASHVPVCAPGQVCQVACAGVRGTCAKPGTAEKESVGDWTEVSKRKKKRAPRWCGTPYACAESGCLGGHRISTCPGSCGQAMKDTPATCVVAGWSRCPEKDQRNIGLLQSDREEVNTVSGPASFPFEIVLDSGAAEHVADEGDAPGYTIQESPGSKAGACFIAANGEKIANQGQVGLKFTSGDGVGIESTFQVCKTHRPLWSVGRICDSGCTVTFDSAGARVTHKASGKQLCSFQRVQGLYVSTLQLRNPAFQRQGARP